jgi:hypothetical protein
MSRFTPDALPRFPSGESIRKADQALARSYSGRCLSCGVNPRDLEEDGTWRSSLCAGCRAEDEGAIDARLLCPGPAEMWPCVRAFGHAGSHVRRAKP